MKEIEKNSDRKLHKCVVLNKCDIFSKKDSSYLEKKEKEYKDLDCDVFKISCKSMENFNDLYSFFNKIGKPKKSDKDIDKDLESETNVNIYSL